MAGGFLSFLVFTQSASETYRKRWSDPHHILRFDIVYALYTHDSILSIIFPQAKIYTIWGRNTKCPFALTPRHSVDAKYVAPMRGAKLHPHIGTTTPRPGSAGAEPPMHQLNPAGAGAFQGRQESRLGQGWEFLGGGGWAGRLASPGRRVGLASGLKTKS